MRYLKLGFVSTLLLWTILSANTNPVKSAGEIEFYFDTAGFRSSLGNVYQEFYYQLLLDQLSFTQVSEQMVDSLLVQLVLAKGKETYYKESWTKPIVSSIYQPTTGILLPDQIDLLCEPGNYTATLTLTEKSTGKKGIAALTFDAVKFPPNQFAVSSVQFASEVSRDTTQSKFTKNGLMLLPNAARIYGNSLPMVIFYYEIYNSLPLDLPGNNYTISYSIIAANGDTVRTLPKSTKKNQGEISVQVNAISTAGLGEGTFNLAVTIVNNHNHNQISKNISFKNVQMQAGSSLKSPVANIINEFNSEQLALHLRQVKYIISKSDFDLIGQLDEVGKKNALIQFWAKHDPYPETMQNEFWENYMNRIKIANSRYSTGYTQGWNTDQGRILIKYGIPDDIERNPVSASDKPNEIWYYYREKGFRFLFVDEQGFNSYRLVGSTHQDEPSDPRYDDLLQF